MLEFVRLEPDLLKLPDRRIIQNQIVVIKLLEFGKGVSVFADADLVKPVRLCGVEETFRPSRVVISVLEVHVIIETHKKIPPCLLRQQIKSSSVDEQRSLFY